MVQPTDRVLRAITDDGAFRVITVSAGETVRAAVDAQGAKGRTAVHFAELITGTVLVRETMAPQLRVQGIVKRAGGRGSIVADSRPGGATRGLLQLRSESDFELGAGSLLQVMRTLPNGSLHQGIVDISATGGLSGALMAYMQESEQVLSVIAVGTVRDDSGAVGRAGGYIVQLLPEVERPAHMIMTERLQAMETIESFLSREAFTPHILLDELLFGMPFTVTGDSPLRFECGCSMTSVLATLATLGAPDITELVEGGELLEIRCDYCHQEYEVAPERLRALLAES